MSEAVQQLPKPKRAVFPDGGVAAHEFIGDDEHFVTAHEGGTLRVWRGDDWFGKPEETPYYDIDVLGMTHEEVIRSVLFAKELLATTNNRKARRAH